MIQLFTEYYSIIPVLIGLAVSIALPFIKKAALGAGAAGSKDKLSVDNAVDFIRGYQAELDEAAKQERLKNFMQNPQSLLMLVAASFLVLFYFLKPKSKR